ncbi:MAG: hypothetical protein L6R39_007115 [Caloplaca ligustica]|nr:MAG: hypothetical protein L6R39_007115 [Caloplaca ligustica]
MVSNHNGLIRGVLLPWSVYISIYLYLLPFRPYIKTGTPVPAQIRNRGTDRKIRRRQFKDYLGFRRKKSVDVEATQGLRFADFKLYMLTGREIDASGTNEPICRTGYMSLPPELRDQILKEALADDDCVWPSRGLTARQSWLRDIDIFTAARRQAWRDCLRHGFNPLKRIVLQEAMSGYVAMFLLPFPTICRTTMDVAPHFLSVCHTAYKEGHPIFYSQNTFHLPHGPLSNTRDYFDDVKPEHRELIRKMILNISIHDLTLEAMDNIEDQLRAKDVANGRLPRDDSVEDWVPAIAYNIISTWRSKLAWIREWTWLDRVTIYAMQIRETDQLLIGCCGMTSNVSAKYRGKHLQYFLKGVGPAVLHTPVMDCYGECHPKLAGQMRRAEFHVWSAAHKLIRCLGWKCTKALVRRLAYENPLDRDGDE